MNSSHEAVRVAIAGAASLQGKELKQWLEESNFPAAEIRLLDEEVMAGTLTEAGGEPAVIETVDEDSFKGVRFVFFTGSVGFSQRHGMEASRAGTVAIDLSWGLRVQPNARPWIPALDSALAPPAMTPVPSLEPVVGGPQSFFLVPSTPAQVAISVSAALAPLGLERLAFTFMQPVSERGQDAITELEDQVAKLLTFQPIPQAVFDAQVGFNMLSRYGPESRKKLVDAQARIVDEVRTYLAGRIAMPGIVLVQAPVFHAHAFTAYAEFKSPPAQDEMVRRLQAAGLKVAATNEEPPNNVNVAGEGCPVLGQPDRDRSIENGIWLWGAADNLRIPATTAVAIAEKLLAS